MLYLIRDETTEVSTCGYRCTATTRKTYLYEVNVIAKWRDSAWKTIICDIPQRAIEYLMPDLSADMNPAGKIKGMPGVELFAKGTDTDIGMREPDVFFNIPMLNKESGNVALFVEQQEEHSDELPRKVFDVFVRVREEWRQPTTCIVIYTGDKSQNVNTYVESCYGFKVTVEFRTYYLPIKSADELRADSRPFARVMLAARLAMDIGNSRELRNKYAAEMVEITAGDEERKFILDFTRRIFQLDDYEISEDVKEVYRMQTMELEEYRKQVYLQCAREEGIEEGLEKAAYLMMARGMPLLEVAETLGLPAERLQQLQPH